MNFGYMTFDVYQRNENSDTSSDFLTKDLEFISTLLSEKENLVKDAVFEIKQQIHTRRELKRKILYELDRSECHLLTVLKNMNNYQRFDNSDKLRRRSELEKKLIDIKSLKLTEELSFWKDVVDLQRELRSAIKEEGLIISDKLLENNVH